MQVRITADQPNPHLVTPDTTVEEILLPGGKKIYAHYINEPLRIEGISIPVIFTANYERSFNITEIVLITARTGKRRKLPCGVTVEVVETKTKYPPFDEQSLADIVRSINNKNETLATACYLTIYVTYNDINEAPNDIIKTIFATVKSFDNERVRNFVSGKSHKTTDVTDAMPTLKNADYTVTLEYSKIFQGYRIVISRRHAKRPIKSIAFDADIDKVIPVLKLIDSMKTDVSPFIEL